METRHYRDSKIRPFGCLIPAFDWSGILLQAFDCNVKYEKLTRSLTALINHYFLMVKTKVRKCDKPWITSSIKTANAGRQKAQT